MSKRECKCGLLGRYPICDTKFSKGDRVSDNCSNILCGGSSCTHSPECHLEECDQPSYETRLRDELIGRAIQGFCAVMGLFDGAERAPQLAEAAVKVADAAMQARKQVGE